MVYRLLTIWCQENLGKYLGKRKLKDIHNWKLSWYAWHYWGNIFTLFLFTTLKYILIHSFAFINFILFTSSYIANLKVFKTFLVVLVFKTLHWTLSIYLIFKSTIYPNKVCDSDQSIQVYKVKTGAQYEFVFTTDLYFKFLSINIWNLIILY